MKPSTFFLSVLPAFALAEFHTQTKRDDAPPASSVRIRDVKTSGSGCPPGSVSIQISADATTVTIGMTKMSAFFGPDFTSRDSLQNCQIHADLTYPGGYQYSVMTATYNGYARLDNGVVGHLTSSYFFSQNPSVIKYTRADIDGQQYETGAPFQKIDKANDKTFIWSPCGNEGILNVNDILSVTGRKPATGEMNVFDATLQFKQEIYVEWRRCGSADRMPAVYPGSGDNKRSGSDSKTRQQPGKPAGFHMPAEDTTFTPTVYSNDMGDWRRPHALTDFETEVSSPPVPS